MKKILFLLTLLLFPITAWAATEISEYDLEVAKEDPGVTTEKGLTYVDNGWPNRFYYLESGEYILTGNISFAQTSGQAAFYIDGKTVTIDLNGHYIESNFDRGPVQGSNANLTIKGEGSLEGYSSEGIHLEDSNLVVENGEIHGIRMEVSGEERYGTLHIKNGHICREMDLNNLKNVIIDNGTFEMEIETTNIGSITINNGDFSQGDAGLIAYFGDSVIINNGKFGGEIGALLIDVKNITINGGTFEATDMGLGFFEVPYEGFISSNITIKGGTFKAYGNNYEGSIGYNGVERNIQNLFESFLSEGYEFTPEPEVVEGESVEEGVSVYVVRNNVSVIHIPYELIKGDKEYTIDSGKTLAFEYKIPFSEFTDSGKVYVDGKLLDAKNYTATEGSTIITLKNDYLDTLKVGEHTIVIVTDLGEVETTFKVVEGEKKNPATVDNITMYALLTLVSSAGLITIRKCKKD